MHITIKEGYLPGCIGRLVQLHAEYYTASNGFDVIFEAKVAQEIANFFQNYKVERDGIWLVECNGSIEGSVVIDGSNAETDGAHLRWFITSSAIQNQGIGKRLLQQAMNFVDKKGFKETHLWTFAGLDVARHLYESHRFELVHQNPGSQWGTLVTEQKFVRNTRP